MGSWERSGEWLSVLSNQEKEHKEEIKTIKKTDECNVPLSGRKEDINVNPTDIKRLWDHTMTVNCPTMKSQMFFKTQPTSALLYRKH